MSVKLLLYCTKAKPYLIYDYYDNSCGKCITADKIESYHLNGKIVAEVEIDKVEEIRMLQDNNMTYETKTLTEEQLLNKSCLEGYQLGNYLGILYENKCGYALHLTNLKVFDRPKELSEYRKRLPTGDFQVLGNAPQNMMNVCEIKYLIEDYILISIKPEHLCKILNGEKTIEVRKKILNGLKEMLEDD